MAGSTQAQQLQSLTPSVNGWNADFLEAEFDRYRQDPNSVTPDLRAFFQGFDLALAGGGPRSTTNSSGSAAVGSFEHAVWHLVHAYQELGHLCAALDPFDRPRERPAALAPAHWGLSDADLDRDVDGSIVGVAGSIRLRDIIDRLETTYCRSIGCEFMHVQNREERDWLIARASRNGGGIKLTRGEQAHVLEQLTRAESFETFLAKRYPGEKRFSLEGAESLIPLLDRLLEHAADNGVQEVVMGMAHRGRLNVLNNILGKTYEQIFTEFEDSYQDGFADASGDVKYHRGYSGVRTFRSGKTLRLAMASNPSHLESVNPIVEGRTRAKQRLRNDVERRRVVPVLIHGDAAIAGQGVVAECLNFSQLEGYTTGGTIHVVVNNMIGFTTVPEDSRSSRYCTDVAKMIDAPILHVNAEDPDAVFKVAEIALEYRLAFRKDVMIDMWCFRKYGHNEQDEQSYTQPILAALIKAKDSTLTSYAKRLQAAGVIQQSDIDVINGRLSQSLEDAQAAAKRKPFDPNIDPGSDRWRGLSQKFNFESVPTNVSIETIREVSEALGRVPDGFNVNPKLKALLKSRAELWRAGAISHADAEMLAFGTLLLEGNHVRLSGQDCRRGTFSQRHAVLRDAVTGAPYEPLNGMRELGEPSTDHPVGSPGADGRPRQAGFKVYDSPLSEMSVLGFEYGYSLADPNVLVIWEAQFGDFVNGAQVIIDQFLASAETKWERWSGLVMLLPHGYEGAGPEHSSCRIERFLQLCAEHNMQVVVPSTGAQTFHLLRRQVKRSFRKPLIVATPKGHLRKETSTIDELVSGRFWEIMDDPAFVSRGSDRSKVNRIVFCSGKIGHELMERRDAIARTDVAIVRVEQLYPFHEQLAKDIIAKYPNVREHVWCQEEPRNTGAFLFISDIVRSRLGIELTYIGRRAAASPAVGSKTVHKHEQEDIIAAAVGPAAGTTDTAPRATEAAKPGKAKAAASR
ncbi:MAG: 2-oxoglutarate dehydrogenase E1 component [Phycisphaeraceae bacterium]|nr:MAG: 2-oxoglutarate dehydrogenase E1 component [Phycisphaeraceae bacterium]